MSNKKRINKLRIKRLKHGNVLQKTFALKLIKFAFDFQNLMIQKSKRNMNFPVGGFISEKGSEIILEPGRGHSKARSFEYEKIKCTSEII